MPCCLIPAQNNPVFPPSLQPDAERFARYVGGARLRDVGDPAPTNVLTSALHLEMKLWLPRKPMPISRYRVNEQFENSWTAMLAGWQRISDGDRFNSLEKQTIKSLLSDLRIAPNAQDCILIQFDRWLLDKMLGLRQMSQESNRRPNLPGLLQQTTALGSFGRCQKLINVFLKYELCWQVAGMLVKGQLLPYAARRIPNLYQCLCALHAPIDRILLAGPPKEKGNPKMKGGIVSLPLGAWLMRKKLLKTNGDLRQSSDGNFRPWSKLDCLRTYYGFQLMLRRVAMSTWASGCACGGNVGDNSAPAAEELTRKCAEWFNKAHPTNQPCEVPDWVKAAYELDEKVIKETIRQLSGDFVVGNSVDKEANRPQGGSLPVGGAKGNRASDPRLSKETPTDSGSQLPKPVIFLKEQSRRGAPHQSALRIVTACDSTRNLGAICSKHHCLDAHQELVDAIARAGGNLMQEVPQCRVAGLCPTGQKPDGQTCCWGGSGYVIGIHYETTEAAVHYLKNHFDVRGCPGNKTWVDGKIQEA